MTLPYHMQQVLDEFARFGVTGRVELEFHGGRVAICRPKLHSLEVEAVERKGGKLSFLEVPAMERF